jgi:hypothetical protein
MTCSITLAALSQQKEKREVVEPLKLLYILSLLAGASVAFLALA